MNKTVNYATATIASGASLSGAIDLGQSRAARLAFPAAWTAADVTVQTSMDGTTYRDLYDKDGTEYTIKAAASRSVLLPVEPLTGPEEPTHWAGSGFVDADMADAFDVSVDPMFKVFDLAEGQTFWDHIASCTPPLRVCQEPV